MSGTTQVFEASAGYQLMVLAAALDSGAFPEADRRILLTSRNALIPETAHRFEEDDAVRPLLDRFDAVRSYNDLIAPLHPRGFRPRADETPLFLRSFRRDLGIPDDHDVELVLESIQVPPARSLLAVFAESSATVYAEGLMSYGPTRDALPPRMSNRIDRLLHLDLVPGLRPLLLTEYGVPAEALDTAAFRRVVGELAAARRVPARPPHALLLGQYLAQLGLQTPAAEARLYGDLVEAAVRAGHELVVYKPHPSAPPDYAAVLAARAEALGARLEVERDPVPAEVLYAADPPQLVLGCFSTGLLTASGLWGVPALTAGTRAVLDALPLYEDSNRVPLVLVDLLADHVAGDPPEVRAAVPHPIERVQEALQVVGYAMQWRAHAFSRAEAVDALRDPRSLARDYVPAERAGELRLPGGPRRALDSARFERLLDARDRMDDARAMTASARRRFGALTQRR